MKRRCIGIYAHVDAGKTTLSEGLLFLGQTIRKMGRVDSRDAFLDTDAMEKARGITIFSKQAQFTSTDEHGEEVAYTLLDTPGHADFSTEMERTLRVLDAAVLVISAMEGVTGQTRTLWSLFSHYEVPVFVFVNKMDQARAIGEEESRQEAVLSEIREKLSPAAVAFPAAAVDASLGSPGQNASRKESEKKGALESLSAAAAAKALLENKEVLEELALLDDALFERYMESGELAAGDVRELIRRRKAFAVYFGSALRMEGVDSLLAGLDAFFPDRSYPNTFAARVFKIVREGNERLTYLRVTGGELAVRQELRYRTANEAGESEEVSEKVGQLRLYSGGKYTTLQKAEAGAVVAVPGLSGTYAGQGLGAEKDGGEGILSPVLTWLVTLPPNVDPFLMVRNLRLLEEEEPFLSVGYNEQKREITVQMMGEVQREILRNMVRDRFHVEIGFGRPSVIYKETIAQEAEGVGHFEPLRHYAEVHLLLEPGEPGSGLVFESACPVDVLARNWQRLVLTHLREKRHRGVLVGGELVDMKITLIGGRAHLKHTEGGDFRQATYRAVRQGLCMTTNVLLEPFYTFRLEIPLPSVGRAMADLSQMGAEFSAPTNEGSTAFLTGSAPVRLFGDYAEKVAAYTAGEGRVLTTLGGWKPCKDAEQIVAESGYDPEADLRNPCGSVFCAFGAGVTVPWYEVRKHMHVDTGWRAGKPFDPKNQTGASAVSRAGAMEGALPMTNGRDGGSAASAMSRAGGVDDMGGTSAISRGGGIDGSANASPMNRGRGADGDGDDSALAFVGGEDYLNAGTETGYWPKGKGMKVSSPEAPKRPAVGEDELMAIFERTYGKIPDRLHNPQNTAKKTVGTPAPKYRKPRPRPEKEYLLVDGYNMIFAWEEFRNLAAKDLKAARDRLLDLLSNYAAIVRRELICVFDAYRVAGGTERVYKYHNITVIYTKEAETADQYIEKAAHELTKQYAVTVATSDAIEQVIIYGAGALRLSARNFLEEIRAAEKDFRGQFLREDVLTPGVRNTLGEAMKKAEVKPEIPLQVTE